MGDLDLDQSQALNRVVLDLLSNQKKLTALLGGLLALSIFMNLLIVGVFIHYEKQFTVEKQTITTSIQQDTEGSGNNVYQAGERATYTQLKENTDGETNGNSH